MKERISQKIDEYIEHLLSKSEITAEDFQVLMIMKNQLSIEEQKKEQDILAAEKNEQFKNYMGMMLDQMK